MRVLIALVACSLAFVVGCASGSNDSTRGAPAPSGSQATIRTVADIPLPGNTSRWDYESFDPQAHRLYIAHLGAGEVVVYDTEQAKMVKAIPSIAGVHGVLAVPELKRVYASATDAQQIAVIDTTSLEVVSTVQGEGYLDGLAYAPEAGKVYVSDEKDGNETVIDAGTNKRLGTVAVGGEAGNTQYDAASRRMYVAVQTTNQVVVVDPTSDQVVERHDTPGCDHPHGLLIDSEQHRAFVACQGNNKLVVMDMPGMQVTSTHDVGKDPDVLAIDPFLHHLYVAAENGPLAVFREDASGVQRIAYESAGPNAHSVAVAPDTHHAFVPLANLNGHPVLREIAVDPPGT